MIIIIIIAKCVFFLIKSTSVQQGPGPGAHLGIVCVYTRHLMFITASFTNPNRDRDRDSESDAGRPGATLARLRAVSQARTLTCAGGHRPPRYSHNVHS